MSDAAQFVTLRSWNGGGKPVEHDVRERGICAEAVLSDGRTVQIIVNPDGKIFLRAWGNEPAKLGNADAISFHCVLPWQEQTHDPVTYQKLPGPPPDKAALAEAIDHLGAEPAQP